VSIFLGQLKEGDNLLAIQGLNVSPTSSDFLISAELLAAAGGGPAGVAAEASVYDGPFVLSHTACVKARVLSGGTWSALNEATFSVGPVVENLRVTEIMYHPAAAEANGEFIELTNVGDEAVDLNLVRFTAGIAFTFGAVELQPGQATVAVQNLHAFRSLHGEDVAVAGQYVGQLDNGGERLRLEDAVGRTVVDFSYDDKWHRSTDGNGHSLILVDPESADLDALGEASAWCPSPEPGGSPGVRNSVSPAP
jgi:hypothetical protein